MSENKISLKLAKEKVESFALMCNKEIEDLGVYSKSLYSTLCEIQVLFDRIRNVPSEKLLLYQQVKQVCVTWKEHVDKIEENYNKTLNTNIKSGAAGAGVGVGIAAIGPTAAMGLVTTFGVASTGTAISALSGAAATNAALAWLGGGTLAAGGGGIAAGNALLALAGPVGWTIAALSFLGSGFLYFKAKSEQKRLGEIFLLISERDLNKYKTAIVEIKERKVRINAAIAQLNAAIANIQSFGFDYNAMTEAQQYALGAYVNLMNSSMQLLVNPILGLQPNLNEFDLNDFKISCYIPKEINATLVNHKDLFLYMTNMLYKIELKDSDRELLSKSFKNNKDFLKNMSISKDDLEVEFFELVDRILTFTYNKRIVE